MSRGRSGSVADARWRSRSSRLERRAEAFWRSHAAVVAAGALQVSQVVYPECPVDPSGPSEARGPGYGAFPGRPLALRRAVFQVSMSPVARIAVRCWSRAPPTAPDSDRPQSPRRFKGGAQNLLTLVSSLVRVLPAGAKRRLISISSVATAEAPSFAIRGGRPQRS